jgi:hypothetical protein
MTGKIMRADPNPAAGGPRLWGLVVEFDTVDSILLAAEKVRDAGFTKWDVHTPFPVHGLNDAMGIRHTRLPLAVLGGGITGAGLGLLMQWWTNAHDYRLIVSGKPFFSLPANIPVMFELTILVSAVTAFVGMIAFNNLPMFYHPVFKSSRFRRATTDRFVVAVEAADPKFDPEGTVAFLESLGGSAVEWVEESEE